MDIYNEDELQAPNWLTTKFLQSVMKTIENNNDLKIINLTVTPGSLKGDHFASLMFRAEVKFHLGNETKTLERSFIIKTLPELGTTKGEMLKDSKAFETEISMYMETIPEIEKFLSEHGDNTRFGPKAVYASLKPRKLIIFEDLCSKGYSPIRGRHLKKEELTLVIEKIAKLHAVSYIFANSENPERVTKYKDGLFNSIDSFQLGILSEGMQHFVHLLENDEELRVYLPQFLEIETEARKGCVELFNAYQNGHTDDFCVLNHGDFHLKNLMFKENSEDVSDNVMFVDFQMSVFGPSVIDLMYGTYMMFGPESRNEKKNEVLRSYFENFIKTLKNSNFKGKMPKYCDLQILNLKYRVFGKYLITTFLPMLEMMTVTNPDDLRKINPDDIMSGGFMKICYSNPNLIIDLKKLLPFLLNNGCLD